MHDTENFKKNIHEDYEIEEELGSGQFAVVRKIVEKETGDEFAAKYVRKKRTKASRNGMSREDIKREIEILRMVDSEKIIKVHDVYETDKEMILVMELLRGGELFDYISKKDFLTEEEAIDFTRQILLALQHLHSRSVVHLDLKPENILLKNTRRKTIKLVDFGLARVVNENEQVREIMGTPEFVAPEVLNFDTISTATDMWALGVIAYILLSGASPFLGEDNQETFTNIIQVDYQFDEEYFAEISDEAKDFIRKLLVKNPRKRPTAHDCSRHPWVEEEVVDKKKRQRRRTTQICTFNFKRFVARKRWKMSYNKIRAMNLIAKMGIKPPPGFITAIPPMSDNSSEAAGPEPVEEKPSSQKDHHKEHHREHHKKKETTINRKKHKQSSSPKPAVEKTDSLTLKTMDIDIGEGESVEPEPELVDEHADDKVEPSPAVNQGPVDYGTMTKREKRRARGQLRTDEIAKSKEEIAKSQQEIDAKKTKLETDQIVNGDDAAGESAPAMDIEVTAPAEEKPAEAPTVTSTINIEHKPLTKTHSGGGILKKSKGRIPSTEDHYFVTLNAALLQDEAFCHSGLQPTRQHGILKHTASAPPPSTDRTTNGSDQKTTPSEAAPTMSEVSDNATKASEDVPKPLENKKVSEFSTVFQSNTEENAPKDDIPESGVVIGLQVDKAVAHASHKDTVDEQKPDPPKAEVKPSPQATDAKSAPSTKDVTPKNPPKTKETTSAPKKKPDNPPQQQHSFTPPPWQRKSSRENLKPSPQPIHGVSKVSLKANRFVSNDKQSSPKSSTSAAPLKPSNVLGKSKLFQKETERPDLKKTTPAKPNSGQELKNVSCDINMDDSSSKNVAAELFASKPRTASQSKVGSDNESKSRSNSQLKVRSDSQTKTSSDSVKAFGDKDTNEGNANDKENEFSVNTSRSRSDSTQKTNSETKTLNGRVAEKSKNNFGVVSRSCVEISSDSRMEVKEELTNSSTHSLTEFTIRPRGNSGDEKAGGFDIMLTIAPPTDQPTQESRAVTQEPHAVTTMKTRFTSSSSSLPDPRSGLPNGRLTSLSTNDMASLSHEPVTSATADRHAAAQGTKYTPQRDFSKYLNNDPSKSVKLTAVPTNSQKPAWQVKRNNPPTTTPTQPKSIVTPKSTNTPTNRQPSATAKAAGAKLTVAMGKGKKSAITSTAYVPRRSFGFTAKAGSQSEIVVKPSEPEEAPKLNNNDESKRLSQSSYTSDRSGSSASSDELSFSNVTAENNALNRTGSGEQINVVARKIENHSGNTSPVPQRKLKATLVLPKECEKVPSTKDRDIRISSSNAPRKNKFTNVRSMWEGK